MIQTRFRFGRRSMRCLVGVQPDLARVAHTAINITSVDFGIHCGVRSIKEQETLVRLGRSRTMNSRHLTGYAIDVHPLSHGAIPWHDWPAWKALADTMKRAAKIEGVEIEWGGDWARFIDGPHFQLPRKSYPGLCCIN
ncbi:M15 family metallopeptidase [Tateyamaria sp.]|uniref:M15 family metallopeptidase n=1 Tax=Tateyamaria sp. TaxID=1929288 RepID=UPI003B20F7F4